MAAGSTFGQQSSLISSNNLSKRALKIPGIVFMPAVTIIAWKKILHIARID